jgi:hypothetical protein
MRNYDLAWEDVAKFRGLGGEPSGEFLRDLQKASGRAQ